MTTLLLAEDDPAISEPLARVLKREGYDVVKALDGWSALAAVAEHPVELVILDLGLPGIDGLDVCRRIRAGAHRPSVLMLTARTDEVDFVVGLDAGADDYVGKPFRLTELLARIRALLRRGRPVALLDVAGIKLDATARRAQVDGVEVSLTHKEFDLLQLLMSEADRLVTRETIAQVVWGDPQVLGSKTIDMHVSSLRHKLAMGRNEPLEQRISTVRGAGLRFNS